MEIESETHTIDVERLRAGIARITLSRPEKRNAVDETMVSELGTSIMELTDKGVSVIVLAAKGPVWCAGIDLDCARNGNGDSVTAPFLELFTSSRAFYIASVEGPALGLGVAAVAMSPLAICRSDVWFSLPERNYDLFPSGMASHIEAVIGARQTMDMALSGRPMSAHDARSCGLVSEVSLEDEHNVVLDRWLDLLEQRPNVVDAGRRAWQSRFRSKGYVARRREMDRLIDAQRPQF